MKRTPPGIALALILMTAPILRAADDAARPEFISPYSLEPAIAIDLNHSGRDAIILRAEQGEGLVIFMPESGGGWSRRLYSNLGAKVTAFAAGDLNRDGNPDLVVATVDRKVATWLGDGTGVFTRRGWVEIPGGSARELGIGHSDHENPPTVTFLNQLGVSTLNSDGWGELQLPDTQHWNDDMDLGARRRQLQFSRWQAHLQISLDHSGKIGVGPVQAQGAAPSISSWLTADFWPRTVLWGDFSGHGRIDIAAIGGGIRPQLQIFENEGTSVIAFMTTPVFHSVVPEIPNSTVVVTAVSYNFSPAPANITAGDSVQWMGLGFHFAASVTSLSCGAPFSSGVDSFNTNVNGFTKQFNTPGTLFYKCTAGAGFHCANGMLAQINVAAPSAGTVPDGQTVPGTPLKITKFGAADLRLTWGASCSTGVTGYASYEGNLPAVGTMTGYNHQAFSCILGNVTTDNLTPTGAGSHYYLIVPLTATSEGSYGKDSLGNQIPVGTFECHPRALPTSC
jgi:plastocyanin